MLWKNARKAKTHVSGFKGGKTWYGSGVKGWERRNHATKGAKNMAGDKRLCLVSWINVFYLTYVKVFIILYIVRSFSKLVLLLKKKSWVDENSLDHGCCPLNVTQHHWIISNSAPIPYHLWTVDQSIPGILRQSCIKQTILWATHCSHTSIPLFWLWFRVLEPVFLVHV